MNFTFSHEGYFSTRLDPTFIALGYELVKEAYEPHYRCTNYLYKNGNHYIELVTNTGVSNRQYHTGYYVDNLEEAIKHCENKGIKLFGTTCYSHLWDANICFLMDCNGIIIELIERKLNV